MDRRAVLSPAQCAQLLSEYPDLRILVEPSDIRIFPDEAYSQAGCTLTHDLRSAEWLLGVKEVPIDHLADGQTMFFFSHTYKRQPYNRGLLKACVERHVRLIDWELIVSGGKRVIGFGVYAGLVGTYEGLRGYRIQAGLSPIRPAKDLGRVALLKEELAHAEWPSDLRVVMTGAGRVGQGSLDMIEATGMQAMTPDAFLSDRQRGGYTMLTAADYVAHREGKPYDRIEFYAHPERYQNAFLPYAHVADIFIPGHYWKEGSPEFFTREDAQHPDFSIKFIGDVSCDIAGPIASTIRPSTADAPFYGWDIATGEECAMGTPRSIGVLAVDNLPSQVPADATEGFGEAFVQSVLQPHLRGEASDMLWAATESYHGKLSEHFEHLAGYISAFEFEQPARAEWPEAIRAAMMDTRQEIQDIVTNSEAPSFDNTIAALDRSGGTMDALTSRLFNANSACTDDDIQAMARDLTPELTALHHDIISNPELFERVQTVYDQAYDTLEGEDLMLLKKTFKQFVRNGARLNDVDKAQLRDLDTELAQAGLAFSEKVMADQQGWFLALDASDVDDLPDSVRGMCAAAAQQHGGDSEYGLALDAPLYVGFMTHSSSRALRRELWEAWTQRAARGDANDTTELTQSIASGRLRRAKLLGYASHADFVLEERMAKTPETVNSFLEDLFGKAWPAAQAEFGQLKTFATSDLGIEAMEPWDQAYVTEKYKKAHLDLDSEALKAYFPLPQVLESAFDVAQKLFGLTFRHMPDNPVYHKEVDAYEVWDENMNFIAHFTADWHPRKGKRQGAWKTSYRSAQVDVKGLATPPVVSIVCNFSPALDGQPSLLTFNEVTTLFHEFGHALHGMLGRGKFASLTGTKVLWDFVELPSQFLENYCYEKEVLHEMARHWETGEPLPDDDIEKIRQASNFLEGMATVRQLGFGFLDMAWHHREDDVAEPRELERDIMNRINLYDAPNSAVVSNAFSHIFAGGYSAGYYSYKWAEVLDADAFSRFQEDGLFDPVAANAFKALLTAGGSIAPDELFRQFRGRDPQPEALLRRAGLIDQHHG